MSQAQHVCGHLPTKKLQEAGIYMDDIKILTNSGLNTIESIAYTPKTYLMTITGFPSQFADEILAKGEPCL